MFNVFDSINGVNTPSVGWIVGTNRPLNTSMRISEWME